MPRRFVETPEPNPEMQRLVKEREQLIRERDRFARSGEFRSEAFKANAARLFNDQITELDKQIASLRAAPPET